MYFTQSLKIRGKNEVLKHATTRIPRSAESWREGQRPRDCTFRGAGRALPVGAGRRGVTGAARPGAGNLRRPPVWDSEHGLMRTGR